MWQLLTLSRLQLVFFSFSITMGQDKWFLVWKKKRAYVKSYLFVSTETLSWTVINHDSVSVSPYPSRIPKQFSNWCRHFLWNKEILHSGRIIPLCDFLITVIWPRSLGSPSIGSTNRERLSLLSLVFPDPMPCWLVLQGQWPIAFVARHIGTEVVPKIQMIAFLTSHADPVFLRRWKMTGASKNIRKCRNCSQLVAAYKVSFCEVNVSLRNLM